MFTSVKTQGIILITSIVIAMFVMRSEYSNIHGSVTVINSVDIIIDSPNSAILDVRMASKTQACQGKIRNNGDYALTLAIPNTAVITLQNGSINSASVNTYSNFTTRILQPNSSITFEIPVECTTILLHNPTGVQILTTFEHISLETGITEVKSVLEKSSLIQL